MKLTTIIIAAVMAATTATAQQQPQQRPACGPYELLVNNLQTKYKESRQIRGLASNGMVVEMFASLETGSWTAVQTAPNGIACIVSAGEAFTFVNEELPAEGEDM
jgi:hypothetical protein